MWSRREVLALAAAAAPLRLRAANSLTAELEKTLRGNILDFWYPRSIDKTNGGYTIAFGPKGEARSGASKGIVTQARNVWFFARLARSGEFGSKVTKQQLLDAADHGYRFLREKMWDRANGGFYWEVDAAGEKQIRPKKHLYGQSFGLYALSELALASGRADVLDSALDFFRLLEDKSHDKDFGGYIEFFEPDWSAPPAGEPGYMGDARLKLMNTHLHLMEAMTAFYRASKLPLARERLLELIAIQSNTVVRKEWGACTDKYTRDWTPRLEGNYARISYGHDIENVWLLMDATEAAGVPDAPYHDLYRTLWRYSMKYGFDFGQGGFYYTGDHGQPADDRNKSWWVQAEALVSALRMYRITREPVYLEAFRKTWEFTRDHQIDWEVGEWHSTVTARGDKRGDKANIWKSAYHNGRAMIECLPLVRELGIG